MFECFGGDSCKVIVGSNTVDRVAGGEDRGLAEVNDARWARRAFALVTPGAGEVGDGNGSIFSDMRAGDSVVISGIGSTSALARKRGRR